jgi:MFS transporter, putative metabolite transport protein
VSFASHDESLFFPVAVFHVPTFKGSAMSATSDDTARSVQSYIDETPRWPDGTVTGLVPLTAMQWRIWLLATAGKFFEGMVVFMTGVALPLIVAEFALDDVQKGVIGASVLAGILIGASLLGSMADSFGRKRMFIIELVIFAAFLLALTFSTSWIWIAIFLFGMGTALGCDYPTAHLVISESIPSKDRGKLVLGAFAFQAVGALVGTAVGYLILANADDLTAWRWMYATAIVPAALVIIGRFFVSDSPHWLVSRGRVKEAEHEVARLLKRNPAYPKSVKLKLSKEHEHTKGSSYIALFKKKNRRATILASVPWFIQDLATYGIGIFTPTILAATIGAGSSHPRNVADILNNDIIATKGAAFLDILLVVGVLFAIFLADRVGRIKLQIFGFIGCAVGLGMAALSLNTHGSTETWLLFGGFMLFNFMTNLGPNAQTYLIAGEVFPTKIRGTGAGFAASFAKIGAVLTAFFFPILLKDIGIQALLMCLIVASLIGAVITYAYRIETAGKNLEDLDS